jgi:hypothetical protein
MLLMHGTNMKIRNRHSTKFCSGNLKEEVVVEDTGVDGRMILEGIRQRTEGFRMYLCSQMTNFCGQGN